MLSISEEYHDWYYRQGVWTKTRFLGVPCLKSVSDMWNYQEILTELKPALVVEFGTHMGGSALYFAAMLGLVSARGLVLTVDVDHTPVVDHVRQNSRIVLFQSDTKSPAVAERIRALRSSNPGNAFFIVDSDHTKNHVYAEMLLLRSVTLPGDYVIIEDGNINGHPVLPGWGPGPYEAVEEYFSNYPDDYRLDSDREQKFGFTFAPKGFLIRR